MKKKWLTVLIAGILAMFVWIFVAVALTGGREVVDFTPRDKQIMAAFTVAEFVTVAVVMVSAVMLGRQVGKSMPKPEAITLTKAEKIRRRRGLLLVAASFLLGFGMYILGILLWKKQPCLDVGRGTVLLIAGYALAVLLPVGGYLGLIRIRRRYGSMSVAERQQFILSHREQAEETAAKKLRDLRNQRRVVNVYAVSLGVLGVVLAFFSGWLHQSDTWVVPRVFFCAFLILAAFGQLQLPVPRVFVEDMEDVLPEEEYPNLYRLARRAAEENGCHAEIRVVAAPENTVGIFRVQDVFLIRMGVLTMAMLTEEELYAVLLHEFAHESAENEAANREMDYNRFVTDGRNLHAISNLTNLFYLLPDAKHVLDFELFRYAAAIDVENRADAAMASCAQAAASCLLKIKYFDLFAWESNAKDSPSLYACKEPVNTVLRDEMARFLVSVEARQDDWKEITKKEIPSRAATHPTTWTRIQNMGLSELPQLVWHQSEEGQKALTYMDKRIAQNVQNYQEARKEHYEKPLERVTQWEAAGSPLVAEAYADLVQDLQTLGREADAIRLCERAIEELSPIAASYARFIRGMHRLYCFHSDGLEDLYEAIRQNSNYIDEGLNLIGSFCCMMGMQEELDVYREKALTLGQRQEDEFSQIGTLSKKDALSEEHLPEGMLDDILGYIGSISQNSISEIYLVRKTISDSFFTSAFVIRFLPEVPEETKQEVLHRIFCYLDTSTDWQFSLFSFEEVPKGLVERVPNSLVFKK